MNPHKLEEMLCEMFDDYNISGGQFKINCLKQECSDTTKNLEISLEKGVFHCWKCGFSGNIRDFFKFCLGHVPKIDEYISVEDLKNFDRIEEESSENPKFKGLPNEFVPLWEPDRKLSTIGQKALQYALSRMSLEDIVSYKIGYCGLGKYKWRLVVPFFEKGEVVYFVARQIYDSPKPYDNPNKGEFGGIGADDVVFNIDGARKLGCAIVCEGVFDAI